MVIKVGLVTNFHFPYFRGAGLGVGFDGLEGAVRVAGDDSLQVPVSGIFSFRGEASDKLIMDSFGFLKLELTEVDAGC